MSYKYEKNPLMNRKPMQRFKQRGLYFWNITYSPCQRIEEWSM